MKYPIGIILKSRICHTIIRIIGANYGYEGHYKFEYIEKEPAVMMPEFISEINLDKFWTYDANTVKLLKLRRVM